MELMKVIQTLKKCLLEKYVVVIHRLNNNGKEGDQNWTEDNFDWNYVYHSIGTYAHSV